MSLVLRHVFITILAFLFCGLAPAAGQALQQKEIDSIIKVEITALRERGEVPKALQLSKTVLKQAIDAQYTDGIIDAYLSVVTILNVMGRYKECLEYLSIVDNILEKNNRPYKKARVQIEYGRSYGYLGLFKQAQFRFEQAHTLLAQEKDQAKKIIAINYIYLMESVFYEEARDTAQLINSLKNAYKVSATPIGAARLAKYYTIFKKNLDSAAFFIEAGDSLYQAGKFDVHQKAMLLRNKGRYLVATRKASQAIPVYKESVAISQKGGKHQDVRDTYKLLYEAFEAAGLPDSSRKYLLIYTTINDSLLNAQRLMLEMPLDKLIQEGQSNHQKDKKRWFLILILIVISSGAIGFYYYWRHGQKNREHHSRLVEKEMEKEALQKEALQLQQTTQQLKRKVNDSFEDLLNLAKQNHPNFYVRFQEVYPDLHHRLLELTPDLQGTELTLCAYIYLDFSTKEIAEYTFKSPKTIQNRKNSLRKRLQIDSSEDLYVWFKRL